MTKEDITYDELQEYTTQSREPFFAIAEEYSERGSKVLDIGCGEGAFARRLDGREVFLIDGNEETVKELRNEFSNVYYVTIPATFPFEDVFFDTIHCSHFVEHLQPQELYHLLQEIDRCLRPGGYLIISAPLLWSGFYNDLSHVRPYTPRLFENYFTKGGPNRTRSVISQSYDTIRLVYRYHRRPVDFFDISHSREWLKKVLIRFSKWLQKRSFMTYERNGFTIVLRKN